MIQRTYLGKLSLTHIPFITGRIIDFSLFCSIFHPTVSNKVSYYPTKTAAAQSSDQKKKKKKHLIWY